MTRSLLARRSTISAIVAVVAFSFLFSLLAVRAQEGATGEVRFSSGSADERDAGVWVDGKYAGYVREFRFRGKKRLLLTPGDHEITIKQSGYQDLTKKITLSAGGFQDIDVSLVPNTKATYPGADRAELRLDIRPKNAAVFVDGMYVGHGSDFGGRFHSLFVTPQKHQLTITLDGYKTYQMEIEPPPNQKTQMSIVLEPGSDSQSTESPDRFWVARGLLFRSVTRSVIGPQTSNPRVGHPQRTEGQQTPSAFLVFGGCSTTLGDLWRCARPTRPRALPALPRPLR